MNRTALAVAALACLAACGGPALDAAPTAAPVEEPAVDAAPTGPDGGIPTPGTETASPDAAPPVPGPDAAPPPPPMGTPDAGSDAAPVPPPPPPARDAAPPTVDAAAADVAPANGALVCQHPSPDCDAVNRAEAAIRLQFPGACPKQDAQSCGSVLEQGVTVTEPLKCDAGRWTIAGVEYYPGGWIASFTCSKGCGAAGTLCAP